MASNRFFWPNAVADGCDGTHQLRRSPTARSPTRRRPRRRATRGGCDLRGRCVLPGQPAAARAERAPRLSRFWKLHADYEALVERATGPRRCLGPRDALVARRPVEATGNGTIRGTALVVPRGVLLGEVLGAKGDVETEVEPSHPRLAGSMRTSTDLARSSLVCTTSYGDSARPTVQARPLLLAATICRVPLP